MPKTKRAEKKQAGKRPKNKWIFIGGLIAGLALVLGGWWVAQARAAQPKEAPEAQQILDLQAHMPFQILIPAYLPRPFIREDVQVLVNEAGPGGEPMVQLTYRTKKGQAIFFKEWVPVNPDMETLAGSRPVETKWGRGWLLRHGEEGLIAIWADIGPLRISIYTNNQDIIDREHLLAIAENMGPASNRQVFNFVVDPPEVREMAPPPPVEATINADGIQEVDLIITPGGYSPLRFAVKKDVPVRLTFRQLGQVGCGNELNYPLDGNNKAFLRLESVDDKQTLEYTPTQAGEFQFFCGHLMYRGVVTVRE